MQYYDEHEEINDLQALSELVPNILDENKVGWRMTSSNDETWKSDQHLLESKYSNECPARRHILSIQNKDENIQGKLANKAAAFEEKELGAEIGLEIIADEDLLSSLNPSKHNTIQKPEDVEHIGAKAANSDSPSDEKQNLLVRESLRYASVMRMNVDDDDNGSGSEQDLKNEVAAEVKLAKDDDEDSDVSSAVDPRLVSCLSQDLDDMGTVKTFCTVKTFGTGKTAERHEKEHDEQSSKETATKPRTGDEEGGSKEKNTSGRCDRNGDDEKRQNAIVKNMQKVTLQETSDKKDDTNMTKTMSISKLKGNDESAAPPTITARMPLSLPTFKPATGCSNASDFIVRCFVARLRSGITVVKHGRSRWCKSRLRILHVHPDGRSLSWKPAVGEPTSSKRPPKLDLSTCQEVRHAWSGDPLHPNYTGTTILRSKCEPVNAHKVSQSVICTTITVSCRYICKPLSDILFAFVNRVFP